MKKKSKYTTEQKDDMLWRAYRNEAIQASDNETVGLIASLIADEYLEGWPHNLRLTAAGRAFYDKGGYQGARKDKYMGILWGFIKTLLTLAAGALLSYFVSA